MTSSDFLVDMGCGTGDINITAANKYRVPGLGVDIDNDLVSQAQTYAAEAGIFSKRKCFDFKRSSNLELGTSICYVSVENFCI